MGAIATPPAAKPVADMREWVTLIYSGDLLTAVHGPFGSQTAAEAFGAAHTPLADQTHTAYPLNASIAEDA